MDQVLETQRTILQNGCYIYGRSQMNYHNLLAIICTSIQQNLPLCLVHGANNITQINCAEIKFLASKSHPSSTRLWSKQWYHIVHRWMYI